MNKYFEWVQKIHNVMRYGVVHGACVVLVLSVAAFIFFSVRFEVVPGYVIEIFLGSCVVMVTGAAIARIFRLLGAEASERERWSDVTWKKVSARRLARKRKREEEREARRTRRMRKK